MSCSTIFLSCSANRVRVNPLVAVTGAAGAFGGYTVQMAKADGLRVVADAAEKDEELVGSLGADVVVRRGDDVSRSTIHAGA